MDAPRRFSRCWSCCAISSAFGSRIPRCVTPARHRPLCGAVGLGAIAAAASWSFSASPTPRSPAPKLDPQDAKNAAAGFCQDAGAFRSARQCRDIVLIEDLHWIDAASEEFVEALADAVVGTTTLLIVNFRPGFAASFMQRSHYRQITMPPLASEQAQLLLQEHFGEDPSLALLSRNISRARPGQSRSSSRNSSMRSPSAATSKASAAHTG